MLVSAFITKLRRQYSDLPIKHRDVRTGDDDATIFKSKFAPVKSGAKLYISDALQAASGYTLDYDTGDISVSVAPSTEVRLEYQEVKCRDQHWLEAIQDSFDSLGDQFFRSIIRSVTGITLSANVQIYDCPSSCIRLMEALESSDFTTSGSWVRMNVNKRYDRRSNKLILGNKPSKANYLKISYLTKLTRPTAVSSVLDVEDPWLKLISLKSGAEYLRARAYKIAQSGNATVEEGHLAMSHLRQLANDNDVMFENLKRKLKPVMPASEIPFYVDTGGAV